MAAWLAAGRDSAVVSHESALDLFDLSDVVPDHVHLTVPRARRGLHPGWPISPHTTVHPVRPEDTVIREGIRLTAPLRTILDAAEMGTGPEQVVMAIEQAGRCGWLVGSNLRARAEERGTRVAELVEVALNGG